MSLLTTAVRRFRTLRKNRRRRADLNSYLENGFPPWTAGYGIAKEEFLSQQLGSSTVTSMFDDGVPLPSGYGAHLDERVIELPWCISRLTETDREVLDAGSALNFEYTALHPALSGKRLTIVNLQPESNCFAHRGVSYLYGDIRTLPFRDAYFDLVACISTIEHVGMDNSSYTAERDSSSPDGFCAAVRELRRVLKPGGRALFSVPYGAYQNFGWFQQFSAVELKTLVDAFNPTSMKSWFYRYTDSGWVRAEASECRELHYSATFSNSNFHREYQCTLDTDSCPAARAVALLELWK